MTCSQPKPVPHRGITLTQQTLQPKTDRWAIEWAGTWASSFRSWHPCRPSSASIKTHSHFGPPVHWLWHIGKENHTWPNQDICFKTQRWWHYCSRKWMLTYRSHCQGHKLVAYSVYYIHNSSVPGLPGNVSGLIPLYVSYQGHPAVGFWLDKIWCFF